MNKKYITIALVAVLIVVNVYLIWRINSNTMAAMSYDAGISQRTGVGKLESFWTEYTGGQKNSSMTYEDMESAQSDSTISVAILIFLDVVIIGGLIFLNKKPKPVAVEPEEDDYIPRSRRRRR